MILLGESIPPDIVGDADPDGEGLEDFVPKAFKGKADDPGT